MHSIDDDTLILCDDLDNIIGFENKLNCHLENGILHRAFSILIFNKNNELLLQKRSQSKMLWPLFWSNSCCSHPRKDESYEIAIQRRLNQELGINTTCRFLYKFKYRAAYKKIGSENELCSVYAGKYNGNYEINPFEIDDHRFISINTLTDELLNHPDIFTPWFKLEWKEIINNHLDEIIGI